MNFFYVVFILLLSVVTQNTNLNAAQPEAKQPEAITAYDREVTQGAVNLLLIDVAERGDTKKLRTMLDDKSLSDHRLLSENLFQSMLLPLAVANNYVDFTHLLLTHPNCNNFFTLEVLENALIESGVKRDFLTNISQDISPICMKVLNAFALSATQNKIIDEINRRKYGSSCVMC